MTNIQPPAAAVNSKTTRQVMKLHLVNLLFPKWHYFPFLGALFFLGAAFFAALFLAVFLAGAVVPPEPFAARFPP